MKQTEEIQAFRRRVQDIIDPFPLHRHAAIGGILTAGGQQLQACGIDALDPVTVEREGCALFEGFTQLHMEILDSGDIQCCRTCNRRGLGHVLPFCFSTAIVIDDFPYPSAVFPQALAQTEKNRPPQA